MDTQPTHRFLVSFGDGRESGFHEVSGLDVHSERDAHPKKVPGTHKLGDVTLKRGVVSSDAELWDWLKHSAKPRTVVVKLRDERGHVTAAWKLKNARPVKVTSPGLNAKGTDVAIEEMMIAYEGLEIEP